MARQTINIGTNPNDGTGDPLRNAYDKCNDNFLELYEQGGANITVNNPVTSTETTLDDALADLVGGGGGAVDSVNGQTGVVTLGLTEILTESNSASGLSLELFGTGSITLDPTTTPTIGVYGTDNSILSGGNIQLEDGTTPTTKVNVTKDKITRSKGSFVSDLVFTDPTANRTITFKDESGTVAYLSDITSSSAYKFVDTTQATYLGAVIGLAETSVAQTTILANTFNANDFMKMFFKVSKSTTVANVTMRVRINTTNNLAGATQIAILTVGTANTYALMNRNINLAGGNAYAYNVSASLASDILAGNTPGTSFTLNTTADLYVFFTIQLGNVADSVTFQLANISN